VLEEYDYNGFGNTQKPYEIVTLVNEGSASASEVFASAMQEHSSYPVIGMQTFGKGTMQLTSPIYSAEVYDENGQKIGTDMLHITIGKWLTSEGNWLHGIGVTPDILVERTATEKAYKIFLDDEVILYDTVDIRVSNIQLILNTMGYTVRTDGYFDQITKNAIMDIQTNNGLSVTGNIDSDTLVHINAGYSAYITNRDNDTQLQASIDYFVGN